MPKTTRTRFECRRCGHCCRDLVDAYCGCVSDADLARWRRSGHGELLARVRSLELGPGNTLHLAWIDPLTGEEVEACPWLEVEAGSGLSRCRIEAVKPDHCRRFPQNSGHAAATGCPGYTPRPAPA